MGNKENKMFCFQCQETAGCSGCTVSGVCGKKPDVAAMQDLCLCDKRIKRSDYGASFRWKRD